MNTLVFFMQVPVAIAYRKCVNRMVMLAFQLSKDAGGNLTSGGSIANLISIVTARDARKITARQIPDQVIYMTQQTHHCVKKAINIAGLKETTIRYINMDDRYRMDKRPLSIFHSA